MTWTTRLRRLGGNLLLSLAAVLIGLLGLEGLLRLTGVDRRVVTRGLYFQASDLDVHRLSNDHQLHYELAPGTRLRESVRFAEGDPRRTGYDPGLLNENGMRWYTVSINEHGARGPAHPLEKAEGVFRIHFHGASTVYGAGVNDDETIPARLEEELNRRLHDGWLRAPSLQRFEVWNYGTSGTVVSQQARLARRRMAESDPDLIVLMRTNMGRRPFIGEPDALGYDPTDWFAWDPLLWLENFPPPERGWWDDRSRVAPADYQFPDHHPPLAGRREWFWFQLMRRSALFRLATIPPMHGVLSTRPMPYAEANSTLEARALAGLARERGVPLRWVGGPGEMGMDLRIWMPGLVRSSNYLELANPEGTILEQESHPPPAYLRGYALRIADWLSEQQVIPLRPPAEPAPDPSDTEPTTP